MSAVKGYKKQMRKVFEYAVIKEIMNQFGPEKCTLDMTNRDINSRKISYNLINNGVDLCDKGAKAAIGVVREKEPDITGKSYSISINNEMLVITNDSGKSINIDCRIYERNEFKNVNLCVNKLSAMVDIGKELTGYSFRDSYYKEIRPAFAITNKFIGSDLDKASKVSILYNPVLEALRKEFEFAFTTYDDAPRNFIRNIFSTEDFYRFQLSLDKEFVDIEIYNMNGTINKDNSASQIKYPTKLINLGYKKAHASSDMPMILECVFDNGWELNFKVVNAASSKSYINLKMAYKFTRPPYGLWYVEKELNE